MLGDSLMLANKAYHSWFSDILSGILDIKIWNLQTRKVAEYKDHVDNINQASEDLSLMTAGNTVLMQTVELIFTNGLYAVSYTHLEAVGLPCLTVRLPQTDNWPVPL